MSKRGIRILLAAGLIIIALIIFVLIYSSIPKVLLSPCEINWTLYNTSCMPDDTIEYYYIDENNCDNSEIIIDNLDPEFSNSSGWYSSKTVEEYYGTDYYFAENGTNIETATWSFTGINEEEYEVYAMWNSWNDVRATNAPYTINYVSGNQTIPVDQLQNGGVWNYLGNYTLNSESNITLTNDADNYVIADAVRLVYKGAISTIPPSENITENCDYNNNKVIGNISDFSQTNIALIIYVNGTKSNLTENFNSERTIEFREGSLTRIKFDYEFETPLNLKNIKITKQPSSSEIGYLIVSGIDAEKTFIVDKINSESWKVCIRDSEVDDIDDMTDKCTAGGEYPVSCPGNYSGFTCNISDNKFIVSGLDNSAVKELINVSSSIPTPPSTCISNWTTCSSWTTCSGGSQTRTCSDTNNCNATIKTETRDCTPPCEEDWTCGSWSDCVDGTQTRTCTDSNSCGTTTDKEPTSQTCTQTNWAFWIIIIVLIIAIIFVIIAIIYFWNKNQQNKFQQKASPFKIQSQPRF